ncbi:YihY/virulence factor BrkB family protein [Sphingomonas sp. TZW2008]|uniref:YihY/virulence factor BrkB family protein n=1 Tax=Sphingomonas sp. TZW2008 TaxID=1917973 RepID=UPI002119DC50|nr:YihY/virulence factor BrkB family protein [Sphingomonas sp. TZW2008]
MTKAADGSNAPIGAGRDAATPWQMPWPAWKQVLVRAWREGSDDNIGLIAAGVAFYGFLAIVPLLGAVVMLYGLVADRQTVIDNVQALAQVMPADAARLVGEQLLNVVQTSDGKKGFGLLLALATALFGARNGAGAVMSALNIAYEEKETRGFIATNLTAIGITVGAVVVAILAGVAIAALGHLDTLLPWAPAALLALGKVLSYALLLLGGSAGAATLYRYGPARDRARWVWLTPGSLLAALLWLALSLGFGLYVANFGNYNATYGSLGAVVVMLTWLYLSSYILLFGAELNSELEHQTARDTTRGAPTALGTRGAWVADHVAGGTAPTKDAEAPAADAASPGQHFAAARGTARLAHGAGAANIGVVLSSTATLGLALIRTRDRALIGTALLGAATLVAWIGRDRADVDER